MPREKHKRFFVYMLATELSQLDDFIRETSPGRENRSEVVRRTVAEMLARHKKSCKAARSPGS